MLLDMVLQPDERRCFFYHFTVHFTDHFIHNEFSPHDSVMGSNKATIQITLRAGKRDDTRVRGGGGGGIVW